MTNQGGGYWNVFANSELTFSKNPISQPPRAPRPSKKILEIAEMFLYKIQWLPYVLDPIIFLLVAVFAAKCQNFMKIEKVRIHEIHYQGP